MRDLSKASLRETLFSYKGSTVGGKNSVVIMTTAIDASRIRDVQVPMRLRLV